MKTISVPLQSRSYPIWVDNGLLHSLPKLLEPMNQGQNWIIFSQNEIYLQFGIDLEKAMKNNGFNVSFILIPNGEQAKSLNVMEKLFSKLLQLNCDRSSTFLAFGGGVVGDLTGFLAAIFMRGVDYIQIPTTLLAMVDSSIGGKTGVNLSEGKNLIGAFWQPKAVVIDPLLLNTLPKREFSSAMGEIIKYGAILDKKLFVKVSENLDVLLNKNDDSLILDIIISCATIKSRIIVEDEREQGKRRLLNFGHTIGHALETYLGFGNIRHGEAVSYGMLLASKLSLKFSNFNEESHSFLNDTILKLPLPVLPKINNEKLLLILENDKKKMGDKHNFILLNSIGSAVVNNTVDSKSIINVLEQL